MLHFFAIAPLLGPHLDMYGTLLTSPEANFPQLLSVINYYSRILYVGSLKPYGENLIEGPRGAYISLAINLTN